MMFLLMLILSGNLKSTMQTQCVSFTKTGMWCDKMNLNASSLLQLVVNGNIPTHKTRLELKFNRLEFFDASVFKDFFSLKVLNLRSNLITRPPHNISLNVPAIESLYLSSNLLPSLPWKGCAQLLSLHLDKNRLSYLTGEMFAECRQLKAINLRANKIRVVKNDSFLVLKDLTTVGLAGNRIQTLVSGTFSTNKNLKFIHLSRNKLKRIQLDLFSKLNLQMLDLSHNIISSIGKYAFYGSRIKFIDLSNNRLKHLSIIYTYVEKLSLSDNPITCDCELKKMLSYVNQTDGTCAGPSSLVGREIQSSLESLNCTQSISQNSFMPKKVDPIMFVLLVLAIVAAGFLTLMYTLRFRNKHLGSYRLS